MRLAQRAFERANVVRLLQNGETLMHGVLCARAVARRQQHDNVRKLPANDVRHVETVDPAGHQNVGKHDIDVVVALDNVQTCLCARRLLHPIAKLFKVGFADLGDFGIVLDQKIVPADRVTPVVVGSRRGPAGGSQV